MPGECGDHRSVLLGAVVTAAQALLDASPTDDDGLPYASQFIERSHFCNLLWALDALGRHDAGPIGLTPR